MRPIRGLILFIVAGLLVVIPPAGLRDAHAAEIDMFADLIKKLGEPEAARKVPASEIAGYTGIVPEALLRFWSEHGRGSYKSGAFWICDPRTFGPVLRDIFQDDPEFDPRRMTVVGYTAFGTLLIWDRSKKQVSVNLLMSTVFNVPEEKRISTVTGQPFSDDVTVGTFVSGMQYFDEPLFPAALQRLERLDDGEIYGFVPVLQLGGAFVVENLRRVRAVEHMSFIAQLQRLTLTRLTSPEPPRYPYGRVEAIRVLGPTEARP
jgi:hypothetical protein